MEPNARRRPRNSTRAPAGVSLTSASPGFRAAGRVVDMRVQDSLREVAGAAETVAGTVAARDRRSSSSQVITRLRMETATDIRAWAPEMETIHTAKGRKPRRRRW
ncbi:hypothetical protein GCM10020254_73160 [Streptomyces goshikiensis]